MAGANAYYLAATAATLSDMYYGQAAAAVGEPAILQSHMAWHIDSKAHPLLELASDAGFSAPIGFLLADHMAGAKVHVLADTAVACQALLVTQ